MLSNDEKKFLDALAKRIVEVRKEKRMTQEKLAEEAGIDRVALANIETGRRRPTVTTLYRLAKALDVHIAYFL